MVSLLQDQANVTFSSSDPLEGHQSAHPMHSHEDSGSPIKQENPGFCCQPYEGENRLERARSESSQSSSPASPPPDQIYGRFSASHVLHAEMDPYQVSPSEKFGCYGCEEGILGGAPGGRFLKSSLRAPFNPYKRQLVEEAFPEAHLTVEGPPFKTASLEGYEEMAGTAAGGEAEMYASHLPELSAEPAWCKALRYNSAGQEPDPHAMDTDVKLKTAPVEEQPGLYCYQPHVPPTYCASHAFHQYPAGSSGYPVTYISASPYPYQRITPHGAPEHPQPLFPKPIYSYSILIFMALKNSKTGSLPVSEIYNFMTEHFPYFKTAPDGWKNSVRHNLSLNKCFEKVENKSGSSSRKGCLWALNPAKIDKMQEELQKWKRKDPTAVRKSMAKPDELDMLIGDKMEKLRSTLAACSSTGVGSPSTASGQMNLQHPSLYAPKRPRGQESPLPAQSPPGRGGAKTLMVPARFTQDVAMPEGDLSNDIDTLNPSLTDFDLQGNLWEELKDDSLALESMVLAAATSSSSSSPPRPPQSFATPGGETDDNNNTTATASSDVGSHPCPPPHTLPDIHLTTLYSAFMELETGSAPFLNSPGSKPIALV
ncbi:forkhead box protein N1 [Pogona vitticeps]